MKIAIILVACSSKQNECFWPSYYNCVPGADHDLIIVNLNMKHVPQISNTSGKVIFESGHVLHKAFGSYREYWNKYKNDYDYFAFISDDVILKSDEWLLTSVELLSKFNKLGFVGTQIFNGLNNEYPHPSHCRAPIWFGKSAALKNIKWNFNSDHEGEMAIADQFLEAGYFGAQVGNKINIGYDALENGGHFQGDHITGVLETTFFKKQLKDKWSKLEIENENNKLLNLLNNNNDDNYIISPHNHIGKRNVISQIQPFHGLVYDKSLELARNNCMSFNYNINILKV